MCLVSRGLLWTVCSKISAHPFVGRYPRSRSHCSRSLVICFYCSLASRSHAFVHTYRLSHRSLSLFPTLSLSLSLCVFTLPVHYYTTYKHLFYISKPHSSSICFVGVYNFGLMINEISLVLEVQIEWDEMRRLGMNTRRRHEGRARDNIPVFES